MLRDITPMRDTAPPASAGFWQPVKYIPLDKSGDSYLGFGGEYRLAYEQYDKADAGISATGREDAVQHRMALHADWHLNRQWRVFSQLGYAAENGRDGGANAVDETDVDIWQLFIDRRFAVDEDERVVLRVGRQLIETANVFITAGEANNIRQYYDGVRLAWLVDNQARFEAFATEYVNYDDDSFDMSGTDEYFWGLRGGMRFQETGINLDVFYLGWNLKDRQFEQGGGGRHDEQRHTLLLWLNRPLSAAQQWGLDYYLAYQFGDYEDRPGESDIRAFAAFGELKHAFYPRANTPIVGIKTSYFSGDSDAADSELNTFYDPVFGTPYFGYARDIMPFNLIQVQPNIGYRFSQQALITLSHEFLWRADTDDAYYNSTNGITAAAGVSNSRQLGQQTQLAVQYRPNDNIIINGYLARLFAGDVIKDAGGEDRDYVHLGFNYLF